VSDDFVEASDVSHGWTKRRFSMALMDSPENWKSPDRVIISRSVVGIFYMQVCVVSDATDEEILRVCNRDNPSGTTHGWTTVIRSTDGNQAPVVCNQNSERIHFLVSC
jgi:hypothetical protein